MPPQGGFFVKEGVEMKKIIINVLGGLLFLLTLIACLVPAIKVKSGDETLSISLVTLLSSAGINMSTSNTAEGGLGAVLVITSLLISPFLSLLSNKVAKIFSIALAFMVFLITYSYLHDIKKILNSLGGSNQITYGGLTFVVVVAAFCGVFALGNYVCDFIDEQNSWCKEIKSEQE